MLNRIYPHSEWSAKEITIKLRALNDNMICGEFSGQILEDIYFDIKELTNRYVYYEYMVRENSFYEEWYREYFLIEERDKLIDIIMNG
jgi:hypothetical protein